MWYLPLPVRDGPGGPLPLAADLHLLGAEERSRLGRLRRPEDRARYAATHAWTRRLVAERLCSAPDRVRLAHRSCPRCGSDAHGPPVALSERGELSVSLSRSGAHGLVALAIEGVVGADIEVEGEDGSFPARGVAERFFSDAERTYLHSLTGPARHGAFFRCWVRKEAVAKALGTGLAADLAGLDVMPEVATAVPVWSPVQPGCRRRAVVQDLQVPDGLRAALCRVPSSGPVPRPGRSA